MISSSRFHTVQTATVPDRTRPLAALAAGAFAAALRRSASLVTPTATPRASNDCLPSQPDAPP